MDLYFYEIAWWKRIVIYLEDEILQMNRRLSRMIASSVSSADWITEFESYQQKFISKNELLRIFIQDCQKMEEKILSFDYSNQNEMNHLEGLMGKLSKEISHFENLFIGLRNDFLLFNKSFAEKACEIL